MPAPPHDAVNTPPRDSDLSCVEILGRYQNRLFISREKLLEHVTLAQKDPKGKISWVEFDAPFHSHLIKIALALFNKPPLLMAKRTFFVFVLEVLNMETPISFFTQKEPASTTTPNLMGRGCQSCGRNFATRKSYTRHTCASRKKVETEAKPTIVPEEPCLVPETVQEMAKDVTPLTPPPPPPPHPPAPSVPTPTPPPDARTIDKPQILEEEEEYDEPVVYLITQYCRSCNQRHNEGPYTAETVEPISMEVLTTCPARGHRLYAKVHLHPIDVESTRQDPGH